MVLLRGSACFSKSSMAPEGMLLLHRALRALMNTTSSDAPQA
jgi:hypothetical protein